MMMSKKKNNQNKDAFLRILGFVMLGIFFFGDLAWAVVGQAERYDPFEAERLDDFQSKLIGEEVKMPLPASDTLEDLEEQLNLISTDPSAVQSDDYELEIQKMRQELLKIPDRDRFRAGLDGQYTYDSNIKRNTLGQEKGESIIDSIGFGEVDLGGKKTDLRFELRGGRQWNIRFSENNFWDLEERLRYRRKYFKKLTQSVQSRFARHSERTIEIDEKKIRYDSHQNSIFNYAFSRKLSMNLELNGTKRLFTTEAFDQDSQWEVLAAPAVFWNLTPKSRIGLGYRFGANRIRSKTGDSNNHEVNLGYFGAITRKSSMSFDISVSHQTPRSRDTEVSNTFKLGTGYIWQWTPKTQIVVQAIRSLQNSSSDLVSGNAEEGVTVKTDSHFINDQLTLSANSRINRKLTTIASIGVAHFKNQVSKSGDEDTETRQFTFPTSISVNYLLKKWLQLRVRYTFAYRMGNEDPDRYRAHTLVTGVNMTF